MLDLESLRLFIRASELGSLSKAAEDSNLALAAVSRRIALLEAHYGVQLLVRTGRGVELTVAGQALLTRARDILRGISMAQADLSDFAKGLRGAVSLQASTSAITQYLPQDLAAFAALCPDLRVDIREAYSVEIAAAVREGRAEVGVIFANPHVGNLELLPYRHDRLVVVAPKRFQPELTTTRILDLVEHDFVVMEDNTAMTRLLTAAATEAGLVLRLRVKVGSFDAVCRMVQAGFGLGVLPRVAAQNFEATMGLRLIELEDSWAEREMLICTNPHNGLSAAAKRLVAHLSACAALELTSPPGSTGSDAAFRQPAIAIA
jgi:DNA-binding transcriptional LysR family regulator